MNERNIAHEIATGSFNARSPVSHAHVSVSSECSMRMFVYKPPEDLTSQRRQSSPSSTRSSAVLTMVWAVALYGNATVV